MNKKVAVGLSGGVDSSVAALLLKEQGFDVIGIFMKNWEEDNSEQCTAEEDYSDVSSVCAKIGIPYYTVNFSTEYWDRVFEYFIEQYKLGRTPNPDVLCNSEIKFKAFLEYALNVAKVDYIATGHYVQKKEVDGKYYLLKGADENKDQSYFLCQLNQFQLSNALFPIGHMRKEEVREIAKRHNLRTALKKDSTGICFIGERNFSEFLSNYLPNQKGFIKDINGKIVGQHNGLMYYTLGQRRGLGIGGIGSGGRWYVTDKDLAKNELIVVQDPNHPSLFSKSLLAKKINWIRGMPPNNNFKCTVKYRYRQPDKSAQIIVDNDIIKVIFDEPQKAVCPGQYVVLYENEICLGGAEIDSIVHI
jgi:tRNA-specific 2-thiouridylase